MKWKQFTFKVLEKNIDTVELFLEANGALAVTCTDAEDNPIFEPGVETEQYWPTTEMTALFDAKLFNNNQATALTSSLAHMIKDGVITPLEDEDWVRTCLQDYHPIKIAENAKTNVLGSVSEIILDTLLP